MEGAYCLHATIGGGEHSEPFAANVDLASYKASRQAILPDQVSSKGGGVLIAPVIYHIILRLYAALTDAALYDHNRQVF